MSPTHIFAFGAAVAAAIVGISIIWVPYGNTGTSDAMVAHFSAMGAVLAGVLVLAGYAYWQSASSERGRRVFSQIVTSYYLLASLAFTGFMFARTYLGMSYQIFWISQLLQYCGLLGIWIVASYAGSISDTRESAATVTRHRKEGIAEELASLESRLSALQSDDARKLLKATRSLSEELRFLPNYVDGPSSVGIFPGVRGWIAKTTDTLTTLPRGTDATTPDANCAALVEEATGLSRKMAGWKRS